MEMRVSIFFFLFVASLLPTAALGATEAAAAGGPLGPLPAGLRRLVEAEAGAGAGAAPEWRREEEVLAFDGMPLAAGFRPSCDLTDGSRACYLTNYVWGGLLLLGGLRVVYDARVNAASTDSSGTVGKAPFYILALSMAALAISLIIAGDYHQHCYSSSEDCYHVLWPVTVIFTFVHGWGMTWLAQCLWQEFALARTTTCCPSMKFIFRAMHAGFAAVAAFLVLAYPATFANGVGSNGPVFLAKVVPALILFFIVIFSPERPSRSYRVPFAAKAGDGWLLRGTDLDDARVVAGAGGIVYLALMIYSLTFLGNTKWLVMDGDRRLTTDEFQNVTENWDGPVGAYNCPDYEAVYNLVDQGWGGNATFHVIGAMGNPFLVVPAVYLGLATRFVVQKTIDQE